MMRAAIAVAVLLASSPASAGDVAIYDDAGRTVGTIERYPTGDQLIVREPLPRY